MFHELLEYWGNVSSCGVSGGENIRACLFIVFENSFMFSKTRRIRKIGKNIFNFSIMTSSFQGEPKVPRKRDKKT